MTMCLVGGSLTGAEIGVKWGPGIGPVSGSNPEGVAWVRRLHWKPSVAPGFGARHEPLAPWAVRRRVGSAGARPARRLQGPSHG